MTRFILTLALALLIAGPASAQVISRGDTVALSACGYAGRTATVLGVRAGTLATLYDLRVHPSGDGPAKITRLSASCIVQTPQERIDAARPVPELPRVELAVNGRLYSCTPQTVP